MDETFSLPVEAACFDDLTNVKARDTLGTVKFKSCALVADVLSPKRGAHLPTRIRSFVDDTRQELNTVLGS